MCFDPLQKGQWLLEMSSLAYKSSRVSKLLVNLYQIKFALVYYQPPYTLDNSLWTITPHDRKIFLQEWTFWLGCCVFQPRAQHPKAGRNIFSAIFQPILLILKFFQWFHGWNQQKSSENKPKKLGFVYSSKLFDMQ